MEIQQLRYALAVIDCGSFTAAAQQCFVAQPSLSQAVRKLERELGVDLFERIGRGFVVTAAGEAFAGAARRAVRAIESVAVEVDAVRGLVAGHLDLVSLPTLAVEPVVPLVGAFRKAHRGVVVRLDHPDGTEDLLDAVATGRSEVGITVLPVTASDLVTHDLGPQEIVAALPPGSSRRSPLDAAALARVPLVTNPIGTSTRSLLDSVFATTGATPSIAVETDQREAIVPLVISGAGVALLPRPMADAAARQGAVIVALQPRLWRRIALVHREGTLSPAARAFVDLAVATR